MDVIKVRNQQYTSSTKYATFRSTAKTILKEESITGFFKGAKASILRECTYSALRMGLYEPVKCKYSELLIIHRDGDTDIDDGAAFTSPLIKILSSFTSGAISSAIFNPIDVIKVRLQSSSSVGGGLKNKPATPPYTYTSISNAFYTIYTQKGIKGLYIGTSATVTRAAFLTCAELGSYDIMKNNILVPIFGYDKEANQTHFMASFIASLFATTIANPADVIKTRVMNDSHHIIGGPISHCKHIWKTNGYKGFMKGWTASYLRIGPHTVLSFVMIEKIRQLIGIGSY
jgi:solute carrier family 25 (mitochondrial dicarboxylate transporter), member 10